MVRLRRLLDAAPAQLPPSILAIAVSYLYMMLLLAIPHTPTVFLLDGMIVLFFICFVYSCFADPGRVKSAVTKMSVWYPVENEFGGQTDLKLLYRIYSHQNIRKPDFDVNVDLSEEDRAEFRKLHLTDVYMTKKEALLRFCRRCELYKPDRSHHCRKCNECHLRMDHHCHWLMNCVGFGNHKAFLLTLVYGTLALSLFCWIMLPTVWSCIQLLFWHFSFSGQAISCLISWLIAFTTLVVIAKFTGYHFYLLSIGMTTLEHQQFYLSDEPVMRNRWKITFMRFQSTLRQNLLDLFGSNPFYWFLPISRHHRDGTYYTSPNYAG